MVPSIQVFVQVALLCCVVSTSMASIPDWPKAFSQLENKVNMQQEEIKSLHHIIEQLEKRLEILEAKGEFSEVQLQPEVLALHFCPPDLPPVDQRLCRYASLYDVFLSQSILRQYMSNYRVEKSTSTDGIFIPSFSYIPVDWKLDVQE